MTEVVKLIQDIVRYGLEKVGLYYSRYRGFVADNNDPDGYGRIKISVPELYGDRVWPNWVWPEHNFSGKKYGVQCLPQIDDLVWVTFEKGNPNKPLWAYGHFGSGDKDELTEEQADVKNYWFQTPGGHLIEFNDTTGTIRITATGGKIIHIGEDFISLGTTDESTEPALLGNTTQAKLEALIDILKSAKVNTQLGPQGFFPNFLTQLDELKQSLEEIKSKTVTLD